MGRPRLSLWPGLPPDVYARPTVDRLPFPLDQPGCRLFAWARHALWRGVHELGLEPGDEVLVPAYHHGSEIEALCQAGLVCRFYDVGPSLEPDPSELESLVGPRTRALHLIHYFGFPQDAVRWRTWCDRRGLFLFEDVAQAWLASIDGAPLGSFGHLAIFCPYKTFGIPHLGLLWTDAASAPLPTRGVEPGSMARLHVKWLTARSGWLDRVSAPVQRLTHRPTADDQALGDPAGPSRGALFLLPRVARAVAGERRRAHYADLASQLDSDERSAFPDLPSGAVPLVFPVVADRPAEMVDRLERQRILARPFWPRPHPSLPADRYPGAAFWRERLVALPVHQELRHEDLARVARTVRGRLGAPGSRLEHIEELDSIREEWSDLAQRTRNVFGSWEWNSIWWRHFGRGHRLHAAALRSAEGRLVAVLPLYVWSAGPLRVLRFIGHGPGDELGPIADRADGAVAARALGRVLTESRLRWEIFLGERLPGYQDWASLLGARIQRREGSPAITLTGLTWEEFLGSLGRRLRHEVRHDTRKLGREHALRFRLADDPARLDRDLDVLFHLHAARWAGSQFVAKASFHREFARCAFERGWLRLWFLEIDGDPVAAWYGFRFGGVESHYQGGRDPAWARSSVGMVLTAHTIKAAIEDGVDEYRFLRGGEQYKYRFAAHDLGLVTVSRPRGLAGGMVIAAAALGGRTRIRSTLRRKLRPA